MVSRSALHNIVGIIGNVISFGLFLSPVPTFYQIYKKKAVEEFQPYPYIATVLNCLLWIFYGLPIVKPDNLLVTTINSVGLVLELIYLSIFCLYDREKKSRKKVGLYLIGELIFFAIIIIVTLLAFDTHPKRSLFVGVFCDIFNVMMYSSPLAIMYKVISTKSVKYMPFYLSLANFVNGCIWTAYALIKFDIFIIISNGLGAISGAVQLILYGWYYRTTPKDDDDAVTSSQVQLSGQNVPARV